MSGASERAIGRASGPVLQCVFFAVLDHSAGPKNEKPSASKERKERTAKSKSGKMREYFGEKGKYGRCVAESDYYLLLATARTILA